MEHPGERHRRTHRVALERERRDHAEVAATPADRPEQVRVRVRRRRPHLPVGAHHLGGQQVVDRHPVLAADPSLPAPEREPGDAGVGHDAARSDEPEGLGLVVHVADQRSTLDAHRPSLRVDVDAVHPGKVEEQAAVDARESRDRVTAPAHGEEESVLAGEVDRGDHVGGACGAYDQRRFPRMHRVVRRADRRVAGVLGLSTSPRIVMRSSSRLSSLIFASEPFSVAIVTVIGLPFSRREVIHPTNQPRPGRTRGIAIVGVPSERLPRRPTRAAPRSGAPRPPSRS